MVDNRGKPVMDIPETLATKQTKTAQTHTHTKTQTLKKIRNIDPIEKIILRI
jgi:hypothetical protein